MIYLEIQIIKKIKKCQEMNPNLYSLNKNKTPNPNSKPNQHNPNPTPSDYNINLILQCLIKLSQFKLFLQFHFFNFSNRFYYEILTYRLKVKIKCFN